MVTARCDTSSTLASAMVLALLSPLLAVNTAFVVVFGIFVVAMAVLVVLVLTWAIRRDKAGRQAWRQRQEGETPPTPGP
jgi:hypothetical protein